MPLRDQVPQVFEDQPLFITDGGLETTLIYHHGADLPCFAAFHLLKDEAGTELLRRYYEPYLAIARDRGVGCVLDTPTWRANRDWGARLGYSSEDLADAVRRAVALVEDLRQGQGERPILLSGAVGPRGDGYVAGERMTPGEAETYHGEQLDTFADTAVDLVTAYTLTYADEAIGIARAARALGLPVVISFTLETDGRLPSGQSLAAAVEQVDTESDGAPAWYLINCAHPTHFRGVLAEGGAWLSRIAGVRANASTKSHAELDEAEELDAGDPLELGAQYRALHELLPHATVLGGCCGTDHLHVAAMCAAWMD